MHVAKVREPDYLDLDLVRRWGQFSGGEAVGDSAFEFSAKFGIS
jgi:hypothetical protein